MANEKRLIDANFLKGIIQEEINKSDFQLFKYVMQKVCDMLDKSPTVDAVEVVHGRWITDEKGITYCGNCRVIDDYASVHNYCPNCGAKMDGDGNDD